MTWWNYPRTAWFLILAEFVVILFFAASTISEYINNIYYQNYVNTISPILVPVLSVAFGAASATVAIRLYMEIEKVRSLQDEVDSHGRKRSQSKKSKRIAPAPSLLSSTSDRITTVTTPIGPVSLEQTPTKGPVGSVVTAEKKEQDTRLEKPASGTT